MLRTHSIHRKTAWSFFLAPLVIGMILGGALVWFTLTAQAESPEPTITSYLDPASLAELLPEPTPEPSPQLHNPTPLSDELYLVLAEACEEFDIEVPVMLGLIERESQFQNVSGDGGDSIGLCQIQPKWWAGFLADYGITDLTDEEQNIRGGCAILRDLMDRYGGVEDALTAYNTGKPGGSGYASTVIKNSKRWEELF